MNVRFQDSELERLAIDVTYTGKRSATVVKKFRNRINLIRQAVNRTDLYALKSLRLEKLKGKRKQQHSIRLNDQYRLIVEFREESGNELVEIIEIGDHYQ